MTWRPGHPGGVIVCDSVVTRNWEQDQCGKPAVTWADPEPWFDEYGTDCQPWPVCAYHAHMGKALPLELHPKGDR